MALNIPRFVISTDSTLLKTWSDAFTCAEAIVQALGPPAKTVILVTPTKHQLKGTTLASALGVHAKALDKGATVGLGSTEMSAATQQTLGLTAKDAVILAAYCDDTLLTKIDGIAGVAGVVAVPEFPDQIQHWVDRWTPIDPTQPAQAPVVLISDPKVEKAMEALTRQMNLSNGLLTPPYKEKVDETLRILFAKGHVTDAAKLEDWAITQGWKPTMAAELRAMAKKVFSLSSKPSLAKFHNAQGKYDSWV